MSVRHLCCFVRNFTVAVLAKEKFQERKQSSLESITSVHEAAHAVVAFESAYHSITGPVRITNAGLGVAYVSLSRSKLRIAEKPTVAGVDLDADVTEDFSIINLAGYAAEKHFCKVHPECTGLVAPHKAYSANDYKAVRQRCESANIRDDLLKAFVKKAQAKVDDKWQRIEAFAIGLLDAPGHSLSGVEAIELIEKLRIAEERWMN